jgi:23S rRNA (uracil1939-C5)-methyltransferase
MLHTNPNNTTTISSLSHDGRGIANINGKVVFIEGALPGESVSFNYTRRHNNFDEAKIVELLSPPSPMRTTPHCQYFGLCGGCALQHLQHKTQLEMKQRVLFEQLQHIGKINTGKITVLTPLTGPTYNYRYKARLSVKYVKKKEKVLVGFHEKNGRFIADMQSCQILHPAFSNQLGELAILISSLSVYQHIPQIEIACGNSYNDNGDNKSAEAALVIRHLQPFTAADIAKLEQFATQHNYRIFLQPGGIDSVHSLTQPTVLNHSNPTTELLYYRLHTTATTATNLNIYFSPTDFAQINSHINQKMVARVLELLDPKANDNILDLFCGIGNFTLPLAQCCSNGKCVGVEGSKTAVQRATFNASANQITNARFYVADLNNQNVFNNNEWSSLPYNKILLDPPRVGALECIQQLMPKIKKSARKIIYISCNPATLARDAHEIVQHGYTLSHAGIMDMFPHTSHIEAITVFVKSK